MIIALLIHVITSKTIYFIPHSHDDVGWLDTYKGIYENGPGVRNIITSYFNALLKSETRKFVQVETIYFKMWWEEQTPETKHKFKQLVKSGQLDFAAGGWSMNDEAASYYEDIIDVFTGGHTYLFEQLGVIPRVGWQIDPFGHSSTHAYISYMMGMDGQYFARIDQLDKAQRLRDKNLEFVWNPKPGVSLFCHINYNHYSSPSGFDFDPLRSSPEVVDSQVAARASQLLNYFTQQSYFYNGDTLVHTLGDDNEWSNAERYYLNIEKVMTYINKLNNSDKIYFTTPHQYLQLLNKQGITYDIKTDDFFPYSDNMQSYWTGYFTSRVGFKGYARYISKEYQQIKTFLSKQLSYGLTDESELLALLDKHGQHLGIAQHHDAITGTARQFVNDDYIKLLTETSNLVQQYMRKHLQILTQSRYSTAYEFYTYYQNKTSRECKELYEWFNDGKTVLMALIMNSNPIITIPVPNLSFTVINQNNFQQQSEVVCDDTCVLYIFVVPEQEIEYYKIIPSQEQNKKHKLITITDETLIQLDNGPSFKLSYHYYTPSVDYMQPSGAYIFRPAGSLQQYGEIISSSIYNGSLLTELIIRRTNTTTKIRKYKHLEHEYEIETFVDSINFISNQGREIVLLIDTDIQNQDTFYTDSNGLDLQKRIKNYRKSYSLISSEPVSQNYYPVTNMIMINQTDGQSVALINDRSQGGTSLKEGQLELMIHRRIGTDDKRGVGEALKEDDIDPNCHRAGTCGQQKGLAQTVIHHLVFYNQTNPNAARKVQLREDMVALKYFAKDRESKFMQTNSLITQSFLDEIMVDEMAVAKIRIEPFSKYFLVRIHNLQEEGSIDIEFPDSVKVYETTMNGLLKIEDWEKSKLNWKTNIELKQEDPSKVQPQFVKTFAIIR